MKRFFITFTIICAILLSLNIVILAEENQEPLPTESVSQEVQTDSSPDETNKIDALINGVTSSTFWVTTVSILISVGGAIALFKKSFDKILHILQSLVTGNKDLATFKHISDQLGDVVQDVKAEFSEKQKETNANISAMLDNYKLMLTCFTIFIESAKINPNAKSEIMKYLTGIKEVSGDVIETVSSALEAIKAADEVEPVIETPKTDAALSMNVKNAPASTSMSLG